MKLDINTLEIDDIRIFKNDNYSGIVFDWQANTGFGELTLRQYETGEWQALTECMCTDEHKEFLTAIFNKFVNSIVVAE